MFMFDSVLKPSGGTSLLCTKVVGGNPRRHLDGLVVLTEQGKYSRTRVLFRARFLTSHVQRRV